MEMIIVPTDQELFPVPNSHINYIFNTSNTIEEYRIIRYINRMVNVFGQDCIVKGLYISSIGITSNNLLVNINKGTLIQDSTIVNVLNDFDKSINNLEAATQANANYIVILYTSFQFQSPTTTPSSNPNSFSINIGILDKSTNIVYNGDPATTAIVSWNTNLYRTIIYAANITELDDILSEVTIGSNTYTIRLSRSGLDFDGYNDLVLFNPDGGIIT